MSEGPDQLSSADMSSLLDERGPIHVHVGGTAIFAGEPPPFDEFLDHVSDRLELIPRFRRRVRWLPGKMLRAEWEDDPDFDLAPPRPPRRDPRPRRRRVSSASSSAG